MIDKKNIVEKYRLHDNDAGSADVQIALLTEKIKSLSQHLDAHKKDHHGRRGLLVMVGQRKRLQNYLRRTNPDRYAKLAESLGIK